MVAEAGVTLLPVAASGALVDASCLGVVDGRSDIIEFLGALFVDPESTDTSAVVQTVVTGC